MAKKLPSGYAFWKTVAFILLIVFLCAAPENKDKWFHYTALSYFIVFESLLLESYKV